MELDEAIKHCEEKAEDQEYVSQIIVELHHEESEREHKAACDACAAEHRQLAAWLRELKDLKAFITSIYQILGEHFEYPCSNEVAAELMKERSTCFDCDGKISNEECWKRFFTVMIGGEDNDN